MDRPLKRLQLSPDDLGFERERRANANRWDELVPHHVSSTFYDNAGFKKRRDSLTPIERSLLGPLEGARVLHLQCHFGQDTLSIAGRGAAFTVGVDLSRRAVLEGRKLAREMGLDGRTVFVEADVLSLDESDHPALREPFDIVFASWGVFGWIPDLNLWSAQAARFLAPGGRLVIAEFHPLATALATTHPGEPLHVRYPYFCDEGPDHESTVGSYAAPGQRIANQDIYWWAHPLADMVMSTVHAGLELESFREIGRCWHPVFSFTTPATDGDGFTVPPSAPEIPLTFVLEARHPDR